VEIVRKPRWITAIGCLRYSDLFASGSWDGEIRLWKLDSRLRSFALVGSLSAPGVVNSIEFISPSKEFFDQAEWTRATPPSEMNVPDAPRRSKIEANPVLLVAAVGHEQRFGRWIQKKGEGVLNGALVVALRPRTSNK